MVPFQSLPSFGPFIQEHIRIFSQHLTILHGLNMLIIAVEPVLFVPAGVAVVMALGAFGALVDDDWEEGETGLATVTFTNFFDVEFVGVLYTVLDFFAWGGEFFEDDHEVVRCFGDGKFFGGLAFLFALFTVI